MDSASRKKIVESPAVRGKITPMPHLSWSPSALSAQRDRHKREQMTCLFEAYFRAAGDRTLTRMALPLDLPGDSQNRYHFRAVFIPETKSWVVQTELKHEYRKVRFNAPGASTAAWA